jgi:CelD/BcsL family acetyltransferase involved in cellulose biosynthesis
MVDIGATTRAAETSRRDANTERERAGVRVDVRSANEAALSEYDAFCAGAVHAQAQHPLWVRSWIDATGADALIATVSRDGRPAVSLALEVVRSGGFSIARFIGGSHANGNVAAMATTATHPLTAPEVKILSEALHTARPDVDLVLLERQNPSWAGRENPLQSLATMESPNISLAVDLSGGFDAMLSRHNGKRKRKKFRLQLRRFEDAGGHRLVQARTVADVDRLMTAFFELKTTRFRKQGITNVFEPADIQAFFRKLFTEAVRQPSPPFVLAGIEVAGVLRGIHGMSVVADGIVCEFSAMLEDELQISPGFFLDYTAMEEACAKGMQFFDFSVGDEDYKRSWCDLETRQFDTHVPLTAKGRMLSVWKMARGRAVRAVKSNAALWSLAKRLRAGVAGGAKPTATED